MVTTRRRKYSTPASPDPSFTTSKVGAINEDTPESPNPRKLSAQRLAYGSALPKKETTNKAKPIDKPPAASSNWTQYLLILLICVAVVVGTYLYFKDVTGKELRCEASYPANVLSFGSDTLRELGGGKVNSVHGVDYGSFAETIRSFSLDLGYDWTSKDSLDAPGRHAVSLRLEGIKGKGELGNIVESYFKAVIGPSCYDKCVLVLDADQTSSLREHVNSFLQERDGALALVIVRNSHLAKGLMQLKSHLDSELIIVNETTSKSVSSRGVGFIFMSTTLSSQEECETVDTLVNDERELKWHRSFLGRITYRSRLCD